METASVHLSTSLSNERIMQQNTVIYSDNEATIGGFRIIDVLANTTRDTKMGPQFEVYREQPDITQNTTSTLSRRGLMATTGVLKAAGSLISISSCHWSKMLVPIGPMPNGTFTWRMTRTSSCRISLSTYRLSTGRSHIG